MKRLTAVLLSLLLVISVGATAFAAFDTSRIDQYFETETQKRIDSMLELVLGKEKAEELLKKYNADGLFVDDSDHVWMTEGMKERFQLLKDTYSISE